MVVVLLKEDIHVVLLFLNAVLKGVRKVGSEINVSMGNNFSLYVKAALKHVLHLEESHAKFL